MSYANQSQARNSSTRAHALTLIYIPVYPIQIPIDASVHAGPAARAALLQAKADDAGGHPLGFGPIEVHQRTAAVARTRVARRLAAGTHLPIGDGNAARIGAGALLLPDHRDAQLQLDRTVDGAKVLGD